MLKLDQSFVMADGRVICYRMVERLGMVLYQVLINNKEVATAMHELIVFNIIQKYVKKAESNQVKSESMIKKPEPKYERVLNYVWLNKDEVEFSIEN